MPRDGACNRLKCVVNPKGCAKTCIERLLAMDNECVQHRQLSAQTSNKQKDFAMDGLLSKSFNNSIESENYDAAYKIIKKAISLGYPPELINTWKRRLDQLEISHRHPLDYALEPIINDSIPSCPPGLGLRKCFRVNIKNYFIKNNIEINSLDEIVDLVFNNLDQEIGKILVPDLTSHEPLSNLISYSVDQYVNDSPEIIKAINEGIIPSAIDHFLRFGFFEIINEQRPTSMCLSHDRKKYSGKILYVVDDYHQLTDKEISDFHSLQLNMFSADIFSVNDFCVYNSIAPFVLDAETYFFQNISEVTNLCILLSDGLITKSAIKWIWDIKLKDQSAIFGYSNNNGIFQSASEVSLVNLLIADVTNGCIIVNSIEVLSVLNSLKQYKSAYGFFHALVFRLYCSGVKFNLKHEILSKRKKNFSASSNQIILDTYWSPFYWHMSNDNRNNALLSSIRRDLIITWSDYISMKNEISSDAQDSKLNIYHEKSIVTLNPSFGSNIAVLIPFKDKIHLLENCVESLVGKKEDINFRIYAINNNSCEADTFDGLSSLEKKYPDKFILIDAPGEFNFSKINNDASKCVEEDYLLFLNNDILFETDLTLTTLLKSHYFHDSIITGARLLYPSGKIQHNGIATTSLKHVAVYSPFCGLKPQANNSELFDNIDSHPWDYTHEASAVTAACMLIKKSDFDAIGGFNEHLKVAYNDIDLCFRAKEAYPARPIICCNEVKIIHLESESRGLDNDKIREARLNKERYSLVNRHHSVFNDFDKYLGIDIPSSDIRQATKKIFEGQHNVISSSGSDIPMEKLYHEQLFAENKRAFACIFVHYDKDATIAEECLYHIRKLGEYCDVYFVSSSEKLDSKPEEIKKIIPLCKQILIRKNSGYDFGCWSHVIRDNYDTLCSYQGVLLCNDSNWGPMSDFSDTFQKILKLSSEADFFGLTSSITPSWHLQSFFILYSKRLFSSSYFKQHWFNIGILDSKYEIVINYEVKWSGRLKRLGFKGVSLYGNSFSLAENCTHMHWDSLLKSNYPYLKKELVRDNPLMVDLQHLPELISAYKENWRRHILEYLKRYGKQNTSVPLSLPES